MEWRYSQKNIERSKCVGIMYAEFTNNDEVYIIALSGPGFKPMVTASGTSD